MSLDELLAAANEIRDESARDWARAGLVPHLAEWISPQEILSEACKIKEEAARAEALIGLSPKLPTEMLFRSLVTACEIGDGNARTRGLAGQAQRWADWGQEDRHAAYAPWPEMLRTLASRTRKDLLSDLRALAPVLEALGGAEAVAETFRAVQDVGRWWP